MRDEPVIVESVAACAEAAVPAAAASLREADVQLGKAEKRAEAALADPPFGAWVRPERG
jgi:hypothetical protein